MKTNGRIRRWAVAALVWAAEWLVTAAVKVDRESKVWTVYYSNDPEVPEVAIEKALDAAYYPDLDPHSDPEDLTWPSSSP